MEIVRVEISLSITEDNRKEVDQQLEKIKESLLKYSQRFIITSTIRKK